MFSFTALLCILKYFCLAKLIISKQRTKSGVKWGQQDNVQDILLLIEKAGFAVVSMV